MSARSFPLFLRLEGKLVLVVGAGPVGLEKAARLAEAGARVRLVDPRVASCPFAFELHARPFEPGDLEGAWLAVAAAPPEVNRAVRHAADARNVFTVAVDDVESCTAFGAASFERGDVTVALSSDGSAPALVALLRRALESLIPQGEAARWSEVARRARREWRAQRVPMPERRPSLLRAMNALYEEEAT